MPIRPDQKHRYPADWKGIATARKVAAGWRCQGCGVRHQAWGWRDERGQFHEVAKPPLVAEGFTRAPFDLVVEGVPRRIIAIVLTVAHRDHQPENNAEGNLAVWCQACHLRHDHAHHQRNAAATRRARMATAELPL